MKTKTPSPALPADFLSVLEKRFTEHPNRHPDISWKEVKEKILSDPAKLETLQKMEATGGEPDLFLLPSETDAFCYIDAAAESPAGRRSFCYDAEAMLARKENRPKNNVADAASEIGAELLSEEQYRGFQLFGEFDLKTSSWIKTPEKIRHLGGALFCDRRYDTVFTYHNGAQSYYAARGFRVILKL